MELLDYLKKAVSLNASDILFIVGSPAAYKIKGELMREGEPLTPADTFALAENIYKLADNRDMSALKESGDDDFSAAVSGLSRFRINALRQRGTFGLIIRVIPFDLPNRGTAHIPDNVMAFAKKTRGLIVLTGPAGSGKSTTLACIVDEINRTRNAHIITIEDPIEYLHRHDKSIVIQREVGADTLSYNAALRAALRETPDVLLIGEMRDAEAIRTAVTAAETGHLVISTLHTLGASNTIDRIIDTFPPSQQHQIRVQLAGVLGGVVSQKLVKDVNNELRPVFEVMTVNSAIRNLIREAKPYQQNNVITQSSSEGMISMDQSLLKMVTEGIITRDEALQQAVNTEWMTKRLSVMQTISDN